MADNTYFNFTPYDEQMAELQRRQKLADLMQQQAIQPLETPQSGGRMIAKVSPLAGLAKMLQAYASGAQSRNIGQQQTELGKQDVQNAMSLMDQLQAGKQATVSPDQALQASMSQAPTAQQPNTPYSNSEQRAFLAAQSVAGGPRTRALAQALLQSAQKENPYSKINPGDYTPESLRAYNTTVTTGNPVGDVSLLVPRVSANTQATIDAEEKRQLRQLGFDQYKFQNLSADQQNNFRIALSNNDLARARQIYETGSAPAGPIISGVNAGQTAVSPTTQRPVSAPVAASGQVVTGQPAAQIPAAQNQSASPTKSVPLIQTNIPPKDKNALLLAQPDEQQKAYGVTGSIDRMLDSIGKLKNQPGLNSILGTVASRTPNITEAAGNAQSSFNTLLNQAAVAALNEMRAASKTGGAVGNVTEKEWPILQSQLANLSQSQSPDQFRKNLDDLETYLNQVRKRTVGGYETIYGNLPPMQMGESSASYPSGSVRLKK
jgi:hypothetical protein